MINSILLIMRDYLILATLLLINACQANEQTHKSTVSTTNTNSNKSDEINYPEPLKQVLDTHGGIDHWRSMGSLSFEIVDEGGNEKHFVQLGDRRDRVEGSNFTMGYDGTDVWMEADSTYKGDPKFYHNLMFYFYAMPFVLADPGINYTPAEPINFEGVTYPGYAIAYEDGVGSSPKDEYYIYFDPESYQMAWLGYTVTYFSGETSEEVSWIRYADWDDFNGIKLPKVITWYEHENGVPTESRGKSSEFTNVKLDKELLPDQLFMKP